MYPSHHSNLPTTIYQLIWRGLQILSRSYSNLAMALLTLFQIGKRGGEKNEEVDFSGRKDKWSALYEDQDDVLETCRFDEGSTLEKIGDSLKSWWSGPSNKKLTIGKRSYQIREPFVFIEGEATAANPGRIIKVLQKMPARKKMDIGVALAQAGSRVF